MTATATEHYCRSGLHDLTQPENWTPNRHQCRLCKAASDNARRAAKAQANGNGHAAQSVEALGVEYYDPHIAVFVTGTDERSADWIGDNQKALEKVLRALVRRSHSVIALGRIALSTPPDADTTERLLIRTSIRLEESLAADREIRSRLGYLRSRLYRFASEAGTIDQISEADLIDFTNPESENWNAYLTQRRQRKYDNLVESFPIYKRNMIEQAESTIAEAQQQIADLQALTFERYLAMFGDEPSDTQEGALT
jgi:hypothetical protein